MNAVTQIQGIAAALAKTQGEIKAAIKDSTNPHFKSKYADLTAVWEACRGPLSKNGLAIVQTTEFDASDVWLVTTLLHTSGESISGRYPLRPVKNDPQGYGSALTYARRYTIAALVGVVADEDDDGNRASRGGKEDDVLIDEVQLNNLRDLLAKTNSDVEAFCIYAKVKSLAEIKQRDYPHLVTILNQKERKRA